MDTFFVSHGPPTLAIDDGIHARPFFQSWKAQISSTVPKSILVVSAHWDTPALAVNSINGPNDTLHEYNGFPGFPNSIYQIKYPAPGAPELASKVKGLLQNAGFGIVEEDKNRGLDHGAWAPLLLMYPEANIPVCQLSIQSYRDGTYHYNIGKALSPLREDGVLIIGSGNTTHNLQLLGPDDEPPPGWAADFDKWLTETLLNGRHEDVKQYDKKAPCANIAHPTPDHLYPLHVALGAAGENASAELIHHSWSFSSVSFASYRFRTL